MPPTQSNFGLILIRTSKTLNWWEFESIFSGWISKRFFANCAKEFGGCASTQVSTINSPPSPDWSRRTGFEAERPRISNDLVTEGGSRHPRQYQGFSGKYQETKGMILMGEIYQLIKWFQSFYYKRSSNTGPPKAIFLQIIRTSQFPYCTMGGPSAFKPLNPG